MNSYPKSMFISCLGVLIRTSDEWAVSFPETNMYHFLPFSCPLWVCLAAPYRPTNARDILPTMLTRILAQSFP